MTVGSPCLADAFAAAMARLGPFEPSPALAVAVSGGADSMALAVLTQDWALQRGGSLLALVVDHGLRPASATEARTTVERLERLRIPAELLALTTLLRGSALAERARTMRYQILSDACRDAGLLHLMLGHHAADQAETLAMRVLRGSHSSGLAGMAALRETATLRMLRPLLGIQPARLRDCLVARGVDWVEDPSNQDLFALRTRLRLGFAASGAERAGLGRAIAAVGQMRTREEAQLASDLAVRATIRPEGFALLSPGPISPAALASLIRTIGGADYPPSASRVAELAMRPKAATVAGVRLIEARDGVLIVREEAAIAGPQKASAGVVWDNRFRVVAVTGILDGGVIGKLGEDAAHVRGCSDLPSVVLRTLPAIRVGGKLAAVPNIGYNVKVLDACATMVFSPPGPVAGARFAPAAQGVIV